ncbi:MAG: PIN domain-containing protein, partial [Nitrospirota bacterium]
MDDPIFVDTNVFLRYFVRDVESFYQRAKELFEKAESGDIRLKTNDLVIAEIVWVLESSYNFSRAEVKEVIEIILETRGIKVTNHKRIREAVNFYVSGKKDFIDAYNIVYIRAKGYKKVATFDVKDFKN